VTRAARDAIRVPRASEHTSPRVDLLTCRAGLGTIEDLSTTSMTSLSLASRFIGIIAIVGVGVVIRPERTG
jgi:hypothetical protein